MNAIRQLLNVAFLLLPLSLFSQHQQQVHWNTAPQKGFVFQITNKDAQKLLTMSRPDTTFRKLLRNPPMDTFDIKTGWVDRPSKGHFILVTIHKNKIHCEYTSVFPYQVFLLKEFNALALQVLDLEGNVRSDAKVKLGMKKINLDTATNTYRMDNGFFRGDSRYVTVELEDFRSVFNIEKHEAPSWDYDYSHNTDDGPDFYSYLITDKNRYKPNEKVRFKSYALSGGRAPLRKELEICLLNRGQAKKIGRISPQRPGSYVGEFFLHDSLKLQLDQFYMLQLRDRNKRVVASCSFKIEDYELFGNQLAIELKTEKQYHPSDNSLTINATDVNGLMLKDATASVYVTTNAIRETFDPVVTLADTIMQRKIVLDPAAPTVVAIPSPLFGKANVAYSIDVVVTTSENQRVEESVGGVHYFSEYELVSHFSNDSIVFELQSSGVTLKGVPAIISHNGNDSMQVMLPFREKINPVVKTVKIDSKLASRTFSMNHLIPTLEIVGGIVKDSFNVSLNNPQKIQVSWFIYQGDVLLGKGSGTSLEYKSAITDRSSTYFIELLYSFGGQENIQTEEYPFMNGLLSVSLDLPDRVYPGQSVGALIKVEDQEGLPVSNVDLTAFAVTSKLGYYPPALPYFGTASASRGAGTDFSKSDVNKRTAILELDYHRWEKLARLDTMKYYQFTYPLAGRFSHTYPITDSTQFAPYVMKNGLAQEIYVIEVDRQPVYYSWAAMPPAYSFYVSPKKKKLVTLRLYDRVLILDSIQFDAGRKTILSIDLDYLPRGVEVVKIYKPSRKRKNRQPPQFTPTEISRHTPLVAGFKPVSQKGYLESTHGFVPLFDNQSNVAFVTVGPIAPGRQTFSGQTNTGRNIPPLSYQHSGGFNYQFEDNVVYKTDTKNLFPNRLYKTEFDPSATMNDLVLTKKQFLESVSAPPNRWHARSVDLMDRSLRVSLLLPEEKEQTGIFRIILEDCKSGKLASPCTNFSRESGYYVLPRGCHNVIVLYNSGQYLRVDGVDLRSYTKTVVNFNRLEMQPPDEGSRRWLQFPPDNCFQSVMPPPKTYKLYSRRAVNGNVQGVVRSAEDNQPLPGVNVVVKGTMNGTVTDINGHFSLGISESPSTLVVSFIGLKTLEIEVQAGSVVSVHLESDVTQLSEVVVVAYGISQARKELAASIMIRGALSGRVAGVQISDEEQDENQNTPSPVEKSNAETKEAEQRLYRELLNLNSIRSNFSDVGFWEPTLITNKNGESKFNVTFPDNITRWDATVYAMNRRLQTGTARKNIKSYKPLMAELHMPQFLTRGDSVFLLGKVLNYTQDSTINGKIKWKVNGTEKEKNISLNGFHTEKLYTRVVSTDTLKGNFMFTRDDGYRDGEERAIPVVEQGIVRAEGSLDILKANDVVTVEGRANEKTIVEILDSPLEVLVRDAEDLIHYRYDCNEQLASKLLALVGYKEVMQFNGKPFRYDKHVNRIIRRLLKNQNEEFLWSWWDVSPHTSYWMSAHILRALKAARDAGYTVDLDLKNLTRRVSYRYEYQKAFTIADADLLNALASWDVELNYTALTRKIDSLIYLAQRITNYKTGETKWKSGYFIQKLLLLEVKQLRQIPFTMDSLMHYKKEGILGDISFTDDRSGYTWYHNALEANTVAYRIVKRDPVQKELTVPMQLYFLKERRKNSWNTYHSSSVIMSVLPDLLNAGANADQLATVRLSGKINEVLTTFPYQIELAAGEELRMEKRSGVPLYIMQYTMERVTVAKTGVDGFNITTALENKGNRLEAGQPVNLLVDVTVKRDASMEYVMIEVPIPGACSYGEKRQSPKETHREYFKEKTVIFCENLKVGTHRFSIPLLPRFSGKFVQNPAQVSLMYVPVVNANTELKIIEVE